MFIKLSETYLTSDPNTESVKPLGKFFKSVMHIAYNFQIYTFLLTAYKYYMHMKLSVLQLQGKLYAY